MQCPACNSEMNLKDKNGILVDYCYACAAYWLDKDELYRLLCNDPQSIAERITDRKQKAKTHLIFQYGYCTICQYNQLETAIVHSVIVKRCRVCGMLIRATDLDKLIETIHYSCVFKYIKKLLDRVKKIFSK